MLTLYHVCNEIPAFFDGKYKQVSSILNVWDILIPHLMVKNIVASGLLGRATYDGSGIQGEFISLTKHIIGMYCRDLYKGFINTVEKLLEYCQSRPLTVLKLAVIVDILATFPQRQQTPFK